jgi:hypothetical protein
MISDVLAGGNILCWGGNFQGELGDNSTRPSLVPVAVQGLLGL